MLLRSRLAALLIGLASIYTCGGCDYVGEGFRDGVEDFVAEVTRKALEMVLPEELKPEG